MSDHNYYLHQINLALDSTGMDIVCMKANLGTISNYSHNFQDKLEKFEKLYFELRASYKGAMERFAEEEGF